MCKPPYVADADGLYTFTAKATPGQIVELAKAILWDKVCRGSPLGNPAETKQYLMLEFASLENEVFACLFLDTRHRVIHFEKMFEGTIDGAVVHPREVVKKALRYNAASIIFAHNHPSGVAEPSQADQQITRRLKDALSLIDVRVLDHIIVGGNTTVSFAERGLL